jgi:predicted RNA-binding protein YlqC (UPF0109 family)
VAYLSNLIKTRLDRGGLKNLLSLLPAMKEFLQFLARRLVENPNEVDVQETSGDIVSILQLRVAKEDLGRVIGRQGNTAHRSALSSTP